jgi:carbon monoxide dehydrogenase subunit G
MELQLAKRYPVAASRAQAWAVLGRLQAVAACMPGAQISEQLDATHYKGQVRVKVGPANLSFAGEIELLECDASAQRLRLACKGSDKGGSAASMELQARLEDAATGCLLVGEATVKVSGKLAQIGNRLLAPASDALLAQFAANFSNAAAAVQFEQAAAAAPTAAAQPLNALGLLLATLKAWWAGLFRR